MSSHPKPTIINRKITLPADPSTGKSATETGDVVSVDINAQTIVTIFGTATALWKQKARLELLDKNLKLKESASLDGDDGRRESLIDLDNNNQKTVTWGPYDDVRTVELTFYHDKGEGWKLSTVKKDKMKEYTDDALETAVSLIPVDDGGHGVQDYQNIIANVSRTTLF